MKKFFQLLMTFIAINAIAQEQAPLKFKSYNYVTKVFTEAGKKYQVRAYEGIIYVSKPVEEKYQKMNIYIPEEYFKGGTINGFSESNAPIFFPNSVGGYMPAEPIKLEKTKNNKNQKNIVTFALSRGFIVASAGARGRTTPTGKAPAVIVDLKAAIRYLKYNDDQMPGDADKIISNGTSAGGAVSLLLGVSGRNWEYEDYLKEVGAAKASDGIYAVSAYCPITLLDIANNAYEWQFNKERNYKKISIEMLDYNVKRKLIEGKLSDEEQKISDELKQKFINNVNISVGIKKENEWLKLDEQGNGNFKEMIIKELIQSAKKAQKNGTNMSKYTFLTIKNNEIVDFDWDKYINYLGRAKTPPAFDALDLSSGENQLFGDATTDKKHFTNYSYQNSTQKGELAPKKIVNLMAPLRFLNYPSEKAKYWRIRHGSKDADTSLAISFIVAETLKQYDLIVDYAIPWDIPHSGDYDLEELFDWAMDVVSKTPSKSEAREIRVITA